MKIVLNVLVGFEFSQVICREFTNLGHNAISCDKYIDGELGLPHAKCDILEMIKKEFDLYILHPPCTFICVSGNRWYAGTRQREEAVEFVCKIHDFLIEKDRRFCIENPVGVLSRFLGSPEQYIQPWQFGHGETKKTGLWINNLPLLRPTNVVEGRTPAVHWMSSNERGKNRSRTYPGVAKAMAEQYSKFIIKEKLEELKAGESNGTE